MRTDTLRLVGRVASVIIVIGGVLLGGVILLSGVLPSAPQVAYMTNANLNYDLALLDLRTRLSVALTDTQGQNERYPAWSPDGERLIFHSDPDRNYDLFLIDRDGDNRQAMALSAGLFPFNEAMADFSPAGDLIAFHAGVDGLDYNIFLSPADGSDFMPVTSGDGDYLYATFSPDGDQLAFVHFDQQVGFSVLYIISTQAAQMAPAVAPRQAVAVAIDVFFPAWSPDGRSIAYVSDNNGLDDVFLLDLETQEMINLTPNTPLSNERHPSWSPDGEYLVFASDRAGTYDLYQMTSDGQDVRRLTSDPADEAAPSWRPN